jgi:hypothetical protein
MTPKEYLLNKVLSESVVYDVYSKFVRMDIEENIFYIVPGLKELLKDFKRVSVYDKNEEHTVYVFTSVKLDSPSIVYLMIDDELRRTPGVDVVEIRDMKYKKFMKYFREMELVWE